MITVSGQRLLVLGQAIFEAMGAPAESAALVAGLLVKANLLGHDSHGIMRVLLYTQQIRNGRLDPRAMPQAAEQKGAALVIDGARGFGQVAAAYGAEQAAALALAHGVGTVALRNTNHAGRLGDYVEMIADRACIGLMMTSGGAPDSNVAPYGGRDGIFGTNPIAWSAPRQPPAKPIVMDYATSSVAAGKLDVARSKNEPVAEGLLLDAQGHPTTDPAAYLNGGVLLPFGGHKGYGLLLMVEIMGRLLNGGIDDTLPGYARIPGSWSTITAWSVEAFSPLTAYYAHVEALAARVKESRPAAGFSEVSLPGDPEWHTSARREAEGIPIPDETWQALVNLADSLGIAHA